MAIQYVCRYCHASLGKLDSHLLTESQLGFDRLTPEERKDIITSDIEGNCQVSVVCESCEQLIESNPDLLLLPHLFH